MTDHKLQVIPLGGLGEFGMNMTAIRYGDDIIVVDSGMMFPDAELLGVDLVMPDLTFLKENQAHLRALILTHGHEDHIGAVPFFLSDLDVPVYGTAFTLALVDRRLEEYQLEEEPRFIPIKPKQIVDIGPFKIEFVHVTHSIVSAVALAITTPLGVIIHTGDFKVDPTPTAPATPNPSAPSARAWKRFSTAPRSGSWCPASALPFTASNWFSISPRSTTGASPCLAAAWSRSPRSRTRWDCSTFPTAFCFARRTPWIFRPTRWPF